MSWKDILKWDEMQRDSPKGFGRDLVIQLEKLGFEIRGSEYDYDSAPNPGSAYSQKPKKDIKQYTHLTEEEKQWEEGYGAYGHELEITDYEEPFSFSGGYGKAKLTIKYIEDNYVTYSNPQNEDFPHKKVTDFKIESVEMVNEKEKFEFDKSNFSNNRAGKRELLTRILQSFKNATYKEEYLDDMTEEEQRQERAERAGKRHAGGAWAAGHRKNVWDD